ncbi:hypothetical protein TIFTF001_037015 [Ficus carica]|uniref:Uncharacterized protein n=1 Tax=Ficus carica TaxID=3494 RepID=A0AA88JBF4_FICCA|nr:hypothetical protein TIFTF001_037015 [Ficus carica]
MLTQVKNIKRKIRSIASQIDLRVRLTLQYLAERSTAQIDPRTILRLKRHQRVRDFLCEIPVVKNPCPHRESHLHHEIPALRTCCSGSRRERSQRRLIWSSPTTIDELTLATAPAKPLVFSDKYNCRE